MKCHVIIFITTKLVIHFIFMSFFLVHEQTCGMWNINVQTSHTKLNGYIIDFVSSRNITDFIPIIIIGSNWDEEKCSIINNYYYLRENMLFWTLWLVSYYHHHPFNFLLYSFSQIHFFIRFHIVHCCTHHINSCLLTIRYNPNVIHCEVHIFMAHYVHMNTPNQGKTLLPPSSNHSVWRHFAHSLYICVY